MSTLLLRAGGCRQEDNVEGKEGCITVISRSVGPFRLILVKIRWVLRTSGLKFSWSGTSF
jgi:hypothetical protein